MFQFNIEESLDTTAIALESQTNEIFLNKDHCLEDLPVSTSTVKTFKATAPTDYSISHSTRPLKRSSETALTKDMLLLSI